MNPDTNKFEKLHEFTDANESGKEILSMFERQQQLLRPDGTPVPKHWPVFQLGENVVIKDYTFKVAYIGESNILFEPAGLVKLGKDLGK